MIVVLILVLDALGCAVPADAGIASHGEALRTSYSYRVPNPTSLTESALRCVLAVSDVATLGAAKLAAAKHALDRKNE